MCNLTLEGSPRYRSGSCAICTGPSSLHNITLSPTNDDQRPTTVRSNDTLVDTPFQLISGFFHVNQGILCSEHAEQASSRGVLERGGGNNRKWIETNYTPSVNGAIDST